MSCTRLNLCKNDAVRAYTVCVTGNVDCFFFFWGVGGGGISLKSKLFYYMWICIRSYFVLLYAI